MMTPALLGIVLGGVWGVIWALCLQTYPGRFLSARFTWITVVVGVGVDLAIALMIVPMEYWIPLAAVFCTSAVGIVGRSLFNEMRDFQTMIRMRREHANKTGQQDDLVD